MPRTAGEAKRKAKARANYLLRRIYQLLDSRQVSLVFKRMSGYAGRIERKQEIAKILLDPTQDIVSVLIHECLHILYPKWSETEVLKVERSIMQHLALRQFKYLLRKIATLII